MMAPGQPQGYSVTALAVHPTNASQVYAGTSDGAFVSYDGGANWQPGPGELDGIAVKAISFDPHDDLTVFYATQGHGVLRERR